MSFRPFARVCALLMLLSSLALAASPTSFCKCTCFGEYKIIPLNAPASSNENVPGPLLVRAGGGDGGEESGGEGEQEDGDEGARKGYRQKTCNDCNKVFCLEQNLPECKDATDQDVAATCFQRDSSKDEAVVFIFIFTTVGLLGWAIVKPWADVWLQRVRDRQQYIPVASDHR